MTLRCQRNSAGGLDVNGAIGLCGRLGQNAVKIDDGIRSCDCTGDTRVVEHIRSDNLRCFRRFSRHLKHGPDTAQPSAPLRHFAEAAPRDGGQ